MILALRYSCLFLLMINMASSAHTIQFIGRVIDNAASARETCLRLAINQGREQTCYAQTGTVIISSIKNTLVHYQGKSGRARIVTINYK